MDMQSLLEALRGVIPDHWLSGLTAFVVVCATLATVLPAPTPTSGTVYRIIYNVVKYGGGNFGKAKNAQDQAFKFEQQKTIPNDGKR